ncbi:MAG: DsbC family protein [Mariprofundales bacterium]|nr:DsbC family protein [Mariprofundales bacterium]
MPGWIMMLVAFVSIMVPMVAQAGGAESMATIKQRLQKQIVGLPPIDSVQPAPIPGLYEVVAQRHVYYSDLSGKHLIINGHIVDTTTRRDLTAARLQEINRIDWNILPLDKAIVSGDPKGMPLAVFTDPDCPFCRKLEQELVKIKGVKVYTFLFPLTQLHKHAREHAEAIWCAKNRHQMMLDIMLHHKNPKGKHSCATPIKELNALGVKLGINGTPTLIAGDGRINAGGMPASRLKAWLVGK